MNHLWMSPNKGLCRPTQNHKKLDEDSDMTVIQSTDSILKKLVVHKTKVCKNVGGLGKVGVAGNS